MANPDAYRKYSADGTGASGQAFTVPFGIDTISDLYVYENDSLQTVGVDYNVTNFGIPTSAAESEAFTVTWIGSSTNRALYTFYRSSPRTQLTPLHVASDGNDLEEVVRRMSYQCQESIFATLEVLDADNMRIQTLAAPIESEDVATYLYAQARYSSQGYLPPPASGIDENTALYSNDQYRLVWKNPFGVPTSPASSRLLQVQDTGTVSWVAEPTYAPAFPTLPSFLSVNAGGSAIEWRVAADLPPTAPVKHNDSITAQQGGTVAWENVEDLPPLPPINNASSIKYVLSMWSKDAIASTELSINVGKMTYLQQNQATTNYGTAATAKIGNNGSNRLGILLEEDLTSQGLISEHITSAKISLRKASGPANSNTATAAIARLTQSWTETGATYNTYDGSNAWPGGAGAFEDVDFKNFVYPCVQRGKTLDPSGVYYDYDVTNLVKDAIDNRSNLLSVYMHFQTVASGSTTWNSYNTDDSSSYPAKLIITHTFSPRQAKWLAVAWGTVEFASQETNSWYIPSITELYTRSDNTTIDILQPHLLGVDKIDVVHNFGMPNIHGISNCQTTSGIAGDLEAYSTAIDASGQNKATVYFFDNGYDFYQNAVTGSQTTSANPLIVNYTIWTPSTTKATSGGEGGSCG